MIDLVLPALVGLLPVATFLAALLYLDSYKLVKISTVVAVVACGAAAAGASYLVNAWTLARLGIDFVPFSRYVSPIVEEFLKGLVIVALIRAHRIGFLVDAAIFGFAVGTGFALVENTYFLKIVEDAGIGTWIVRGFGTAIMHGGATAIFAVMGLAMLEATPGEQLGLRALAPGLGVAIVLHSAYNHLLTSPRAATLTALFSVPALLYVVFQRSEKAVGEWLGQGFDADTEMLDLINSGRLSDSPVGKYLHTMKAKFRGPVVADLLCYLRLYTELALRAKGILMMRENGFEVPVDEPTRAKFAELSYLETSIGKTGLLAIQPMCHMSHKDLWQLYMLGK
ncbi:MAG: PrsW family glutamic-type intramembrane protease [Burkholderiales bacterium]